MEETHEKQMKDSDIIFKVVLSAANNIDEANKILMLYITDKSFSRSGCSHALGRIERHFKEQSCPKS